MTRIVGGVICGLEDKRTLPERCGQVQQHNFALPLKEIAVARSSLVWPVELEVVGGAV